MHSDRGSLLAYQTIPFLVVMVLFCNPNSLTAEEALGRPWGRLSAPSVTTPEAPSGGGYLGKYNPWADSANGGASLYFRQDDIKPSTRLQNNRAYPAAPGSPSTRPNAPMQPDYSRNYRSSPQLPSPLSESLFGNNLNPNYGNYWNDPYEMLQPSNGVVWPGMMR